MHIAWNTKGLILVACVSGLTALAALVRLGAQEGIPLYPDSFQSMLFVRALSSSVPADPTMGVGGDPWAIPFYKLGYPLLTWPFSALSDDPFMPGLIVSFIAGTATVPVVYFLALTGLQSRTAAIGAALATALSFSATAWSRFVMSEATAMFWIALTLLLAVVAGRARHPRLGILTGISAAVMILVRMELVLLLPTVVLLMHRPREAEQGWAFEGRYFVVPGLTAFVILSAVCGWLAQNVAEGFTLNPSYFVRAAFSRPPLEGSGPMPEIGMGLSSFVLHEPLLVLLAAVGLAGGLRAGVRSLWALCPGLLLLALIPPRNDIRFLAPLVPLLAYAAGYGFEGVWKWTVRQVRGLPTKPAFALSVGVSLGAILLVVSQISLTESRWHPDQGYEYQVTRGIEQQIEAHGLDNVTVCSYSPEAVHLISGLPTKRLSSPDLSKCASQRAGRERVLVIVDEAVRRQFGEDFELEVRAEGKRLFEVSTSVPYLRGAKTYSNPRPATAYLLE